jgi:hypothetical protein
MEVNLSGDPNDIPTARSLGDEVAEACPDG